MALEIKGMKRVFKMRKNSQEIEDDRAVYEFKTTIGVKG